MDDTTKLRYHLLLIQAPKTRAESVLAAIQKEYPEEVELSGEGSGWLDTDYLWRFEEWEKKQ